MLVARNFSARRRALGREGKGGERKGKGRGKEGERKGKGRGKEG